MNTIFNIDYQCRISPVQGLNHPKNTNVARTRDRRPGAKKAHTALRLCKIHPSGEPPEGHFLFSEAKRICVFFYPSEGV